MKALGWSTLLVALMCAASPAVAQRRTGSLQVTSPRASAGTRLEFEPGAASFDNIAITFQRFGSTGTLFDNWFAEVSQGTTVPRSAGIDEFGSTLSDIRFTVRVDGLVPVQYPRSGSGLKSPQASGPWCFESGSS